MIMLNGADVPDWDAYAAARAPKLWSEWLATKLPRNHIEDWADQRWTEVRAEYDALLPRRPPQKPASRPVHPPLPARALNPPRRCDAMLGPLNFVAPPEVDRG